MTFPFRILTPLGSGSGRLRLHPDVFCKFFLTAYPTSNGTELLEVAVRPLADSESFKEGRITGMSRINRKASDWKGNFQNSSVTIQFTDADCAIRNRLRNGSVWMYFLNREAQICALSPEGRREGNDPTILFRGWISDAQVLKDRMASITISDVLSSQMAGLNLDKKIGVLIPGTDQIYPILGGEGTDVGFLDAAGNPADIGVLGVIEDPGGEVIVPATAPSPTPTPDDPEPPDLTLFTREVEVVAGIVAGGAGNIGEETWFKGYAHKNGHAVTPVAIGQTGVNNPGVYVDAIDVYWNAHTADDTEYFTADDVDGYWFFRYTGGPNAFDPFDGTLLPGTKVAFIDIPFDPRGAYAVPGMGGLTTEYLVRFDAMPGNAWTPPAIQTVDPPVITDVETVGDGGTVTRYYQATAISTAGQTTGSNVFQKNNTPSALSDTSYPEVIGTYDVAGTTEVRVYGGITNPPTTLLGAAELDGAGNFEFHHTASQDNFAVDGVTAPQSNTATLTTDSWVPHIVSIGAIAGITKVYGTDRAEGTAAKRVEQTSEWFGPGGEILAPGFPGWPFANSYIVRNGIRQTVIYLRGEILRSHRAGEVGVTVNFCGPEEIGDGTGNVIDGALYWLEWFLNEMVLKNHGAGYQEDSDWFDPDLERYDNGESIIETDRFRYWQELFPYKASIMITEQLTLREILRRFCRTFGVRLAITRRGQVRPFYISDGGNPEAGFMLRHKIEATDIDGDPVLGWNEVANRISAKYSWAASRQDYLVKNVSLSDLNSIAAHRPNTDPETEEGAITDEREMPYVNDPDTVDSVLNQELVRYRKRPEFVSMVADMYGLNMDIGDLARYTHPDKVSAEELWTPTDLDSLTQGVIEEHGIDGMLRQTFLGLRDITAINNVLLLNQGFLVVNDNDLAVTVTNDDDEAPIVL